MKAYWFARRGLIFIPVSLAGWTVLLAGLGYAVWAFMDIDSRSHSVSDTLINFLFRLLLLGVGYSTLAFFTSAEES